MKEISRKRTKFKKRMKKYFLHNSYVITIFLSCVTLIFFSFILLFPESTIDIDSILNDLKSNLYYQNSAVATINNTLHQFINQDQGGLTILGLIGSSGVGKTLSADIIKSYFHGKKCELRPPLDSNIITLIQSGLIVVEDLVIGDVDDLLVFIKKMPSEANVLLIYVLSIQETDTNLNHFINYNHIDVLKEKFFKAKRKQNLALFREFKPKQVRDWIARQLAVRGMAPEQHADVLKMIMRDFDLKYQGLKGLSSKINLIL